MRKTFCWQTLLSFKTQLSSSPGEKAWQEEQDYLKEKPLLPILILIILPFLIHLPLLLLRISIDPIWTSSGLGEGMRHVIYNAGNVYGDGNVGWTTEALGHLAAWDWVHGIVPWWNSFSGIGLPLAGEMQSGAFFLPFNLLLLLPHGVLWLKISMQIVTGLTTYALLRELELSRLSALMGALLYAMNGTLAWTPGPASVFCSLPFLPLLLWGIEQARKSNGGPRSIIAIGSAIAWSILAGFPEVAYLNGLLALVWSIYRLFQASSRWALASRILIGGIIGLLLAAPQMIAFADYVLQSDIFASHIYANNSLGWRGFPLLLIPYVYGPLGEGWGSSSLGYIWGSIGGYVGVLIVMLAISAFTKRTTHNGLKFVLLTWILLTLGKSFGVPLLQTLVNYIPLIKETVFHRYAPPSWELAIIILAAIGHNEWQNKSLRWPLAMMVFLIGICIVLAWPQQDIWKWSNNSVNHYKILAVATIWALTVLILAAQVHLRLHGYRRRLTLACLLVLDAAILFAVPVLAGVRPGQIDQKAITFLQDNLNLSRSYTLGPMQPNYSAYFQTPSLNYNVLPVPTFWANYLDQNILPELMIRTGGGWLWVPVFGGKAGQDALPKLIRNYAELGVRYVITDPGDTLALPQVYADSLMRIWEIPEVAPYFEVVHGGPCKLLNMQREMLNFDCTNPATLMRRELYTPGWTAQINGEPIVVSPFHEVFQMIALPQGQGKLHYDFAPLYSNYGWIAFVVGTFGLLFQIVILWMRRMRPNASVSKYLSLS